MLTAQLLAFSRRQVIQPRSVNLTFALGGMRRMLRRLLRDDIVLKLTLGETGLVKVDAVQLQQVVINLLVNAQDAMPDGGCITIETADVELDTGYVMSRRPLEEGSYVLMAVTDTGIPNSKLASRWRPELSDYVAGMPNAHVDRSITRLRECVRQGFILVGPAF